MEMLSPTDILSRCADKYAACASYRDRGEVVTLIKMARGTSTERKPFSTHFINPDCFRFEYFIRTAEPDEKKGRYVIWSDRGKVGSHWSYNPSADNGESLGTRLAAATGVSGGSAHTIPSLLLPSEIKGGAFDRFDVEARSFDASGTPCYRLDGRSPHVDAPLSYWIDAESFLIRRIHQTVEFTLAIQDKLARDAEDSLRMFLAAHPERAREFPAVHLPRATEAFSTVCTTCYTPELDPSIAPEVFTDPLGPHGP